MQRLRRLRAAASAAATAGCGSLDLRQQADVVDLLGHIENRDAVLESLAVALERRVARGVRASGGGDDRDLVLDRRGGKCVVHVAALTGVDDEAAAAAVLEEAVDGVGQDGALPVVLVLGHESRDELGPVVDGPGLVHHCVGERCLADERSGAGSDCLDGAWPGGNLFHVDAGRVVRAY